MSLPKIGYLTTSEQNAPLAAQAFGAFKDRLAELGHRDGQTVTIEHRSTIATGRDFAALAQELASLPVNVLVVGDSRAIPAAKQATQSSAIPVVMAVSGDVVGDRLVNNLVETGNNLTGLTIRDPFRSLDAKRLELLLQMIQVAPQNSRVAVLRVPDNPGVATAFKDLEDAAKKLGVTLIPMDMQADQNGSDLPQLFQQAASQQPRPCGLVVLPDPLANLHAATIVQLAAQHQLPAIYGPRLFVEAGGLMSYGPDRAKQFQRAAEYVHEILSMKAPAALPRIQLPGIFELVVNKQTVSSLNLSPPPELMSQATPAGS